MSDMQHSRDMADAHADRELEAADRARRAEWDAAETAEMHEEVHALRHSAVPMPQFSFCRWCGTTIRSEGTEDSPWLHEATASRVCAPRFAEPGGF